VKAIHLHGRGGPEHLVYEEAPQPHPGPGEVVVRVYAAGVIAPELIWSATYETNAGSLRSLPIPGHDLSGVVEEVGPGVATITRGAAVYALTAFDRDGTAAEYTIALSEELAPKPRLLDHVHAAAVPLTALTAWQALFDQGQLQAGQRVLILGGSGGVGIFAVQFAHRKGAQVITTTSTSNVAFVRSLGADVVIDYTQTRVEDEVHQVDLVLDTVGGEGTASALATLKPGGTLLTIAGQPDVRQAQALGVRTAFFPAQMGDTPQLLTTVSRLIDEAQLRTSIAATFPLSEAAKAQELSQRGHGRGRIILHVA